MSSLDSRFQDFKIKTSRFQVFENLESVTLFFAKGTAKGTGHFLIATHRGPGKCNYHKVYKFNLGQTYHVVIAQTGDGIFKIEMDGNVIEQIQNENPQDFDNVKAYFSDPWHAEFHGCLSNLQVSK